MLLTPDSGELLYPAHSKTKLLVNYGQTVKEKVVSVLLSDHSMWVLVCTHLSVFVWPQYSTDSKGKVLIIMAYMSGAGFITCTGRALQAFSCSKIWTSRFFVFIRWIGILPKGDVNADILYHITLLISLYFRILIWTVINTLGCLS